MSSKKNKIKGIKNIKIDLSKNFDKKKFLKLTLNIFFFSIA